MMAREELFNEKQRKIAKAARKKLNFETNKVAVQKPKKPTSKRRGSPKRECDARQSHSAGRHVN